MAYILPKQSAPYFRASQQKMIKLILRFFIMALDTNNALRYYIVNDRIIPR